MSKKHIGVGIQARQGGVEIGITRPHTLDECEAAQAEVERHLDGGETIYEDKSAAATVGWSRAYASGWDATFGNN